MDYIEFSKDLDKAEFSLSIGTSLEENQNHVLVGLSKITNQCRVGDATDTIKFEAPFFGLMFFHPESIDALIRTLEKAKEMLQNEGES